MDVEHKDLSGANLHPPFNFGAEANTDASPNQGDWYYATDTDKLYRCAVAGTWELQHGNEDQPFKNGAEADTAASPAQGDWYYATDTDKLYKCQTAGTWEQFVEGLASLTAIETLNFVIDGGGSVIGTGIKGDVVFPFAATLLRATLLADQSGSIVVDIWKDTYANFPPTDADSITGTAPTISAATKSQDATLAGWTTDITADDILRFNVDSCTSIQRVTLELKYSRTLI